MDYHFLIVIIYLLSLSYNTVSEEDDTRKCPDNSEPKGFCSDEEECENGNVCYRDVQFWSNETMLKEEYGCCDSRCPLTGMPYGMDYEEDTQSTVSFCSNLTESLFYLDKKSKAFGSLDGEKYGCCPRPISDFVYGKVSGVLVNETYSHPKGWTLDETTGEVSGIKTCCTMNDCDSDSYCGAVRNPGTMKLVTKKDQTCKEERKSDKIETVLRFCYLFPNISLEAIGISEQDQNSSVMNFQLCKTHEDCWNPQNFCQPTQGHDLGVCRPVLGSVVQIQAARDAFLIYDMGGCSSDEQCDELGQKYLSYQCEATENWKEKVCIGYERLCSKSALYEHGQEYGCQKDQDCLKNAPNDGIHIPKCVKNRVDEGDTSKSVCCYEMNSCNHHADVSPVGLSPLEKHWCSNDNDCQEIANHMMENRQTGRRNVYWGRCMEELVNHFGKCCIADVSSLCSVGKSLIPPRQCSNHSECGFDSTLTSPRKSDRNPWCGDEGYCCQDHPGEQSWMCPDGKTIRVQQPKCDSEEKWCEGHAGYCTMGRCCPMVKPPVNFWIYVFAESPWYYHNLSCTDVFDLPADMDMIYCDPKRKVVTRVARNDKWGSAIRAEEYGYCGSNEHCTSISSSLVCVKELGDLHRCHTYYDRDLLWYMFIAPGIVLVLIVFLVIKYWWHDVTELAAAQWEVWR